VSNHSRYWKDYRLIHLEKSERNWMLQAPRGCCITTFLLGLVHAQLCSSMGFPSSIALFTPFFLFTPIVKNSPRVTDWQQLSYYFLRAVGCVSALFRHSALVWSVAPPASYPRRSEGFKFFAVNMHRVAG
jgi:hypothetical protein